MIPQFESQESYIDLPIAINCSWCNKEVALVWICLTNSLGRKMATEMLSHPIIYLTSKGGWSIGMCPSCNNCSLIQLNGQEVINIFPHPRPTLTNTRIPENIRRDIEEAKLCLSVKAFRATATMCRRSIQQACLHQGTNKSITLDKQIDELKEKGIITEAIRKWAHTCRFVGNDASHPEHPDVTESDANDVLKLAEQLMIILYVMPAISEEKNEVHERKK